MRDKWHLRFAITANCNFDCKYCSSRDTNAEEMKDAEARDILLAAYHSGIKRIHWTGGEPLVRKNLSELVKYAREIGYSEQSITTNGYLLPKQAECIIKAGITRINISMDTLHKESFKSITGRDGLQNVLNGIDWILENTVCSIKINMVVMKDNLQEVNEFLDFSYAMNAKYGNRIIVRFLQFFPCNPNQLLKDGQEYWKAEYVTEEEIIKQIESGKHMIKPCRIQIEGDNPTIKYFSVDENLTIGILAMFSWNYPCGNCYKLRITPFGFGSCCLSDDKMFKLSGLSVEEKEVVLKQIIERRENEIEKNTNRRHYRKKLGEVRFGEKGNSLDMDFFYQLLTHED